MSDRLLSLLAALRHVQMDLTGEDVADTLWLAPHLAGSGVVGASLGAGSGDPVVATRPSDPALRAGPTPVEPVAPPPTPLDPGASPSSVDRRGAIYLPATGSVPARGGQPVRVPTGPPLPGSLAIARSLRPLRRRVPSPARVVLDVEQTVRRVAEEGLWVPTLRPAPDRWLALALVVDGGRSMDLWRPMTGELYRLLSCTGAFRTVRPWVLDTESNPPRLYPGLIRRPGLPARPPHELVDPSGRTLVLVLTDCISRAWHDGGAGRVLETWSARGPVALIQVLPEHFWSRTALGAASPLRLSAPGPAAPNALLTVRRVSPWDDAPAVRPGTPVPVACLEPGPLAAWAALVAGVGQARAAGFILDLEPPVPTPEPRVVVTPDTRRERFWQVASPTARRLAGLLAAAPVLTLPVIRLVRQALVPEARQVHEAEVLLGGLLRVVSAPAPGAEEAHPDEVRYDFHDGLRSLLLDAVPTADACEVLERVSAYIAEHHGEGRDFRAVLADPIASGASVEPDSSPFARVAAEVLLRLGGDHARLVARGPAARGHGTAGTHGTPIPGGSGTQTPRAPEAPAAPSPRRAAGAQSIHPKMDRIRRPRVHITYDVEVAAAAVQRELPFVIGVLADLSGHPAVPLPESQSRPRRDRDSRRESGQVRVRPPRVQINYDVEVADTSVRKELPFVVGTLADLSDRLGKPPQGFRSRKFVQIDRDNFDAVLEQMAPRLSLWVPNRLKDDGSVLTVELRFRSIDDFQPEAIVEQVEPLRSLLEMRKRFANFAAQLDANDALETILSSILVDRELTFRLAEQLRRASPPEGTESPRSASPSAEADMSLLVDVLAAVRPRGGAEAEATRKILSDLISAGPHVRDDRDLVTQLREQIGRIDRTLSSQVAEILHHSDFQRLEATWRGLHYLVRESETGELLKIKILNVSKSELLDDQMRAVEFDQSMLFRQVYEHELGVLGGEPYGLLVGDYEFSHRPQDIMLLRRISSVAAAAHAPFIAAASPVFFGLRGFTELAAPRDIAEIFRSREYDLWRSFRESEDSRYVGLTLPRVLMRLPYGRDSMPIHAFDFEEVADSSNQGHFLWASAAWAFAARVADAFAKDGWPAAIWGREGGGLVRDLPVYTFLTDKGEVAAKCPTDVIIMDRRELELSQLGFLPLGHLMHTDSAAFVSTSSCQKPRMYANDAATANASLSSQIHVTLCVSRFAHYLMALSRDKVGAFMSRKDCEDWLNRWINNYVTIDKTASEETKRRYPLREARISVEDEPGRPGAYRAVVYLKPHLELEELTVSQRVIVALPPAATQ